MKNHSLPMANDTRMKPGMYRSTRLNALSQPQTEFKPGIALQTEAVVSERITVEGYAR
jgi:hypothetical protein